jgi:ornithine cyclodeaminase
MTLSVLDAAATATALPYPRLAQALETMLERKRAGVTVAPERLAVPLNGGVLLAMPAADHDYAVTKLVTVHAGNAAHGLPSLLGEVLLMKADTGERLLMLDGPTVTARRTAALSALAAQRLGAPRGADLLVVGAGVQARAHIAAFVELLGVRSVRIASRGIVRAHALADELRASGVPAEAVADVAAAAARSAIVVTATTATSPVIPDALGNDAFVAAVGAYRPDMCELPASLIARARVVVDDLPGARHEAGDILQAQRDFGSVEALEDALYDGRLARDGRPVVFKSVGQALWDLAAARLAWEIAGPRAGS